MGASQDTENHQRWILLPTLRLMVLMVLMALVLVPLARVSSPRRQQSVGSGELPPEQHSHMSGELHAIGLSLLSARESGNRINDAQKLPLVLNLSDAYSVHSAMTEASCALGPHVGWKCGACAPAAQKAFNLQEPFRAPLFQHVICSDAATDRSATGTLALEAEFGFVLRADLPPRPDGAGPYSSAEVWGAVGLVVPSIEVVGTRWAGEALRCSTPLQVGTIVQRWPRRPKHH